MQQLQNQAEKSYTYFGMHQVASVGKEEQKKYSLRVWAPNAVKAEAVFLNESETAENPLREAVMPMNISAEKSGVWELLFEEADLPRGGYYFQITTAGGERLKKADPYGFAFRKEMPWAALPHFRRYVWKDAQWQSSRSSMVHQPLLIYEVHLGAWKRSYEGKYLTYRQMEQALLPYVKKMDYTHIELMPLTEYPYDPSWGYQPTGYFAPTARYGDPYDLKHFIDACHNMEIGVILDWVPAHFPKDSWGLIAFDGTPCYEDSGDIVDFSEWNTLPFAYEKEEVQSFLLSSAEFWLEEFHFDGLRVDAAAAIQYGDGGCSGGNQSAVRKNLTQRPSGIYFMQQLSECLHRNHPYALLISEDSSQTQNTTAPIAAGGLQFDYRWNMGWAHDTLAYFSLPPEQRRKELWHITFSTTYAFSERFLLPLSHDETANGKGSLYRKMPGNHPQKLAGIRTLLAYQMCHPGKKLLFMGNEWAQMDEWRFGCGLQWELLHHPMHEQMWHFTSELNHFYRSHSQLWREDDGWAGFRWISADDTENGVVVFLRTEAQKPPLVIACNFGEKLLKNYRFGLPKGSYCSVFSTDASAFGGENIGKKENTLLETVPCPMHGFADSVSVTVPPLSVQCWELLDKLG